MEGNVERTLSKGSVSHVETPFQHQHLVVTPDIVPSRGLLELREPKKDMGEERKKELQRKGPPTLHNFKNENIGLISKRLKCVNCSRVVQPKESRVTMCAKGHLMCDICTKSCARSTTSFCEFQNERRITCHEPIRVCLVAQMHEILVEALFPCKFRYSGCDLLVNQFPADHEKFCEFNPSFCCFIPNCESSSELLTMRKLIKHLMQVHDAELRNSATHFSVPFPRGKNPIGRVVIAIIRSFDLNFVLLMELQGENIYFWTLLLNNPNEEKFSVKCKIKTQGSNSFIKWDECPKPLKVSSEELFKQGQVGIQINKRMFKTLFLADSTVKGHCRYFTIETSIEKK